MPGALAAKRRAVDLDGMETTRTDQYRSPDLILEEERRMPVSGRNGKMLFANETIVRKEKIAEAIEKSFQHGVYLNMAIGVCQITQG